MFLGDGRARGDPRGGAGLTTPWGRVLVAAGAAGLGGLLIEAVAVRRLGLLLGNTAEAAAAVLALFLLGLGIGGLLVRWLPLARRGPVRWAALLYGGVAVASPVFDALVAAVGPASWPVGLACAALSPGLLAVAMGAAFPLVFSVIPAGAWPSGLLVGANLLGSVVAAWCGANLWIPTAGLGPTVWGGAAAYGGAGLLLATIRPATGAAERPRRVTPGRAAVALAAGSGILVIGLEVLLLRRLPFWLEGFQPTLAGVLATTLLSLTIGAAVGTPLLRRLAGRRAAAAALILAALSFSAGLHEWWSPSLASYPIESDFGLHARIFGASLAAAALPCLFAGAVVPLLLARLRHPRRRPAMAGVLFFWQGVGALAGALLAGHLLPWLLPRHYFVAGPIVIGAVAVLVAMSFGARWLPRPVWLATLVWLAAAGLVGAGGAGTWFAPRPPIDGARYDHPEAYTRIAHRSDSLQTASAVYDRRRHSMLLFTDGFRAAETGPGTAYMLALGHLPMVLRPGLSRVAVIALGTGTTADAVSLWPAPATIDVVEISPAVLALAPFFAGDGPVQAGDLQPAWAIDPRSRVHLTDGRRFLARQPPGTLDLITLEPLLPYAPGTAELYSAEFYALAARALAPGGLIVQWLPTHAMPTEFFDTLLATFARGFDHTSVWLVDQSTLLVGSAQPHLPRLEQLSARLERLPPEVAAALHRTGLPVLDDYRLAYVGDDILAVCGEAAVLHDERPVLERIGYWSGLQKLQFYPQNLVRLRELAQHARDGPWTDDVWRQRRRTRLLALAQLAQSPYTPGDGAARQARSLLRGLRVELPRSVLLHREETLALRRLVERVAILRGGRGVAELAWRHLQRDPASAFLYACSALEGAAAARAAAVGNAVALDPLLFTDAPAFLAPLDPGGVRRSPLEDLQQLPAGATLLRAILGAGRGLALRATFPVVVARALVGESRVRALTIEERAALRQILDPLSFELAVDAVVARDGNIVEELYDLWRPDFAMPPEFARALAGGVGDRLRLARILEGHRGNAARAALAQLLLDPDLTVRTAASVTLFSNHGQKIPYDPTWEESRRRRAAERLR